MVVYWNTGLLSLQKETHSKKLFNRIIGTFYVAKIKSSAKKNTFPRGIEKEEHLLIQSSRIMGTLAGDGDRNLRKISELIGVRVTHAVDGISVFGLDTDVDLAISLLKQLLDIIEQGGQVFEGDIELGIRMLTVDRSADIEKLIGGRIDIPGGKLSIVPRNPNQKRFIESLEHSDVVFGVGPAGTGKTYLAIAAALSALLKKRIRRVILCRPAVEAGEKLGFLPGDMTEKVSPYLRPMYDALFDMVGADKIEELFEKEMLEVAPLAFMRGRTLKNAYVVLDEAQNTTAVQMKMFLTRLGSSSKFFVTGDITQIDLVPGQRSGLVEAVGILKNINGISIVKFDERDVVRHPLVAKILEAYK
jgi:phosphate starvation-inducible PhoH-like protein